MTITLGHLAVGMAVSVIGSISMLWATWVRPAHAKEVALQVRLAKMEARLDAGDKRFVGLDRLEKQMQAVLTELAAIKTLMRERGGIPDQE